MKAINTVKYVMFAVLFSVLGFSLSTIPKVNAVFESLVGQNIEGPEFVRVVTSPTFSQIIHKNEISLITYDPNNNLNSAKYTMSLRSGGPRLTITESQYDALVKQLDFTELKVG